ncbi:MAG: response regulator [Oculatellaceae cyanobacterium bins.114]|nr:response regulator [Oculatellaceae cyanobacterium bins.114]
MCALLLRKDLRVLIVDGDADSRELLIAVFKAYGVEAIATSCVSESLTAINQARPDLLISELAIPGQDGYELIRQVKALETTDTVQILAIALTTYTQECDRVQSLAAGFHKHLSKPLNIDQLIETVNCLMGATQVMTIAS